MPDQPITLLSRKHVCTNAVFSVYLDHIRDSLCGEVVDYLSVVPIHRTADGVTGVAVLPIVGDRLALLRVSRHPLGTTNWEIARGFINEAEAPAAAALRELFEETGLCTSAQSLRPLGTIAPEAAVLDARVLLYAAENCSNASASTQDEIGHHGLRLVTPFELMMLIDSGEILDPCTLVTSLKYLASRNVRTSGDNVG